MSQCDYINQMKTWYQLFWPFVTLLSSTKLLHYLIYKGESMCVCPAACRQTHTTYHPKIWWHFTRAWHQARGKPEMLAPGHAHSPAHFCSLVPQISGSQPVFRKLVPSVPQEFKKYVFLFLFSAFTSDDENGQ